jgi:ubiquinone/menaquinone biosynthesis C-methylase UbiE
MDFSNPEKFAVFFDVHSGLPREAPGNRESTQAALSMMESLPEHTRILDIACGPGMQTLDLASLLPNSKIMAVDLNEQFVLETSRRVQAAGLADRVTVEIGNMKSLGFEDAAFDLIWCEGGAYIMGVKDALAQWRRLLKPNGKIALTDAVWLRENRPTELTEFWSDYPDMNTVENRRELIKQTGYKLLGDFVLPESAWWEDYYGPMHVRLKILQKKYAGNDVATEVINECFDEIALYKAYPDYYGYVFLIMST